MFEIFRFEFPRQIIKLMFLLGLEVSFHILQSETDLDPLHETELCGSTGYCGSYNALLFRLSSRDEKDSKCQRRKIQKHDILWAKPHSCGKLKLRSLKGTCALKTSSSKKRPDIAGWLWLKHTLLQSRTSKCAHIACRRNQVSTTSLFSLLATLLVFGMLWLHINICLTWKFSDLFCS